MNHGTREDNEEVDRYRTEHLVAVCCNMRMGCCKSAGLVTAISALNAFKNCTVITRMYVEGRMK